MASKKKEQVSTNHNKTGSSIAQDEKVQIADPEGYNTENYICMRNAEDGSMYYGEVGYLKIENGHVIKHASEAYNDQIKSLTEEQRLQSYQMVRHGYGLQLYNGSRNADGILTKYEGNWDRNMKQGQGFAVYADGSTYKGKFKKDVKDGIGTFNWAQGHEYKGHFRDGQMDGPGKFKHSNGTSVLEGCFRRNQFEKENCYVNPLDEEKQHERVIQRLVSIQQHKADAALQLQAQLEADQEAQRQQEIQAELEIQKTIGSTQHFEEGEDGENMYGMESAQIEEMDQMHQIEQENDF